jgi:hypothetical protein
MTTAGRVAIDLRIIGRRLPGLRWSCYQAARCAQPSAHRGSNGGSHHHHHHHHHHHRRSNPAWPPASPGGEG